MSSMATQFEDELELEDEYEGELEDEDEAFLGSLGGIARAVGGQLGQGEGEWEDEAEGEYEDEFESHEFENEYEFEDESAREDEAFLGGIARTVGGLLGEGEWEDEEEYEDEAELFFGRLKRIVGKVVRNPVFRQIVKRVGPMVATAVGGPAAGMLARAAVSQLEGELEDELEAEFEDMATAPLTGAQAMAEFFAAQAAHAESEAEAEAFAGVAAYTALSARDRRDLERMLPALLRGSAVITRLLRRDPRTRAAVRMVPGIVDATGRALARRVGSGARLSPADVGAIMGATAHRALAGAGPRSALLRRHAHGIAHVRRHHPGGRYHGTYRGGSYPGRTYRGGAHRTGYGQRSVTVRRQPVHSGVTTARAVPRPRPGFVRVVTPVRVPAQGGTRTVRVVSDVRVPRGAVPAGRPVSVGGRRTGR